MSLPALATVPEAPSRGSTKVRRALVGLYLLAALGDAAAKALAANKTVNHIVAQHLPAAAALLPELDHPVGFPVCGGGLQQVVQLRVLRHVGLGHEQARVRVDARDLAHIS